MSQKAVNLTLLMVERGVDVILPTYPYDPYQTAFQQVDQRDRLILFVLRQLPSSYILTDLENRDNLVSEVIRLTFREHLLIKSLIHQGIHQLLPTTDINPPAFYCPPKSNPTSRKSAR